MRLLLLLLVGPLALASIARAQSTGATAFSLATMDPTPRGAGLAGSVSASAFTDAGAWLYNPALLSNDQANRLSFSLTNHLSSLRTGSVGYARTVPGLGTAAAGLRFLGWGELERTDAAGANIGTFSASEFIVTVAASREFSPNLRAGLALNALRSAIDSRSAGAISFDAGLVFHRPETGFSASASLHQAGLVFSSLGSTGDALPVDVRVGISKKLRHMPLLLAATGYGFLSSDEVVGGKGVSRALTHLLLGAEFQFSDSFQLRLGYDHRRHEALKIKSRLDFAGISFGAGLRVKGLRLDYARTSWSSLGAVHRFGFSTGL